MAEPAQIWECAKCGQRYTAPLRATQMWCGTCTAFDKRGYSAGKVPMTLIWSKGDGPIPEPVVMEGA